MVHKTKNPPRRSQSRPSADDPPADDSPVDDSPASRPPANRPVVGLFVTCLVDALRPSVGLAAIKLLSSAGCRVIVPQQQTCCGQPAWNSGDAAAARAAARPLLTAFDACEHIVVPSGSCGGMLRHHLPDLFAASDDAFERRKAAEIAAKTSELTAFLHDVMKVQTLPGAYTGRVAYHDSCSSLREMKVEAQPRALLRLIGAEVTDLENADTCCGFGGLFSVKFGAISATMADNKAEDITARKPDILLAGDMGCLINIAGRLSRRGNTLEIRHIAEVLAGEMTARPIGGGKSGLGKGGEGT